MPVVSSYNAITGANLADGDDFLVVDVSDTSMAATGTTKRIKRSELPAGLGLGKYVAVGYGGNPTWIDPAATDWADVVAKNYGWIQFIYGLSGDAVDVYIGRGDGTSNMNLFIDSDGDVFFQATTATGSLGFDALADRATFFVTPVAGQIADMASLGSVFGIAPDGSVGGVTPSAPGWVIKWDGSKWKASAP